MSDLEQKVKKAIERIRSFESMADNHADDGQSGYYLAFSGGKDSVALKALMDMAGVKYDAHYRLTSVDPPELVRFIKDKHPDVVFEIPRYPGEWNEEKGDYDRGKQITMWNLIPKIQMPPTRIMRYCCNYLKEGGGDGRFVVTGVRWDESANRARNQGVVTVADKDAGRKMSDNPNFQLTSRGGVVLVNDNSEARQMLDACVTRHKTCLNPMIDWTDAEVWEFIRSENIPYCSLYDEGWHRLGCIGCPMARKHGREREFARWPKVKTAYIKAFDRMLIERDRRGKENTNWINGQDVFNWWMEYDELPGQYNLFEDYDEFDHDH